MKIGDVVQGVDDVYYMVTRLATKRKLAQGIQLSGPEIGLPIELEMEEGDGDIISFELSFTSPLTTE